MKTAEWIAMLAAGDARVPRRAWALRHAMAVTLGLMSALLVVLLAIGVRNDFAVAAGLSMFWVKQGFPLLLASAAFVMILRLSRPGLTAGPAAWMVPLVVLGMWAIALTEWIAAAPGRFEALLFGQTWRECLLHVPLLSIPAFFAGFAVLRTLAPTRPAFAGGVAGFLAGCIGAFAYSFHCPELAAAFIGTWYLLGMLIPAGIGAILGVALLRW